MPARYATLLGTQKRKCTEGFASTQKAVENLKRFSSWGPERTTLENTVERSGRYGRIQDGPAYLDSLSIQDLGAVFACMEAVLQKKFRFGGQQAINKDPVLAKRQRLRASYLRILEEGVPSFPLPLPLLYMLQCIVLQRSCP
jgi:hypothetical protein